MRQPVEGTVAYGRFSADLDGQGDWAAAFKAERADFLKEDQAFYTGLDGAGRYLTAIPVAVTPELLARGQERFNIYCVVCHGYNGSGNGMVGQRWTGLTVANFHDPKYSDPKEPDQKGADGFIFHTALEGVPNPADAKTPKMPGYRHALTERDAWAIVSYVRTLQQSVPLDQVPDAELRRKLEDERAKLPPAPPPGATGATGGTGSAGATSATGSGTPGSTGAIAGSGSTGSLPVTGAPGATGATAPTRPPSGPTGATGSTGATSATGSPARTGAPPASGPTSPPKGKS